MSATRDVQESMFPDLVPARPQGWIMPSVFAGTNAELMKAIAPMYLTGPVCDVTYGQGKWWEKFKPVDFVAHDLIWDNVDFRRLPHGEGEFDTVCFDPPYVASGKDDDPRAADFNSRYGIGHAKLAAVSGSTNRVDRIEELVVAGLHECLRVARRFVLVKCMEFAQGAFASSAHARARVSMFHDVPHVVKCAAIERGWETFDVIVHHAGSGPGGHNIFEPRRARRHHSYLLVFTPRPS